MPTVVTGTVWLKGPRLGSVNDTLRIQKGAEGVGFYPLQPDGINGNAVVHDGVDNSDVTWDPCCMRVILISKGTEVEQEYNGQLHFVNGDQLRIIGPDIDGTKAEILIYRESLPMGEGGSSGRERR